MSRAGRTPVPSQEQQGDEAVALAHELSDRIARERQTVKALKDHLISAVQPVEDPHEEERLHAPSRQAPAVVGEDEWLPLGEVLCWRRGATAEGSLLLELAGEVDMSGALRLRTLVSDLLDAGERHLSLDLGRVTFMDSNGLSALLWVRRRAMTSETGFAVTEVHPQLLRLLHVTKLDSILLG